MCNNYFLGVQGIKFVSSQFPGCGRLSRLDDDLGDAILPLLMELCTPWALNMYTQMSRERMKLIAS